jgi:hypothetical protein
MLIRLIHAYEAYTVCSGPYGVSFDGTISAFIRFARAWLQRICRKPNRARVRQLCIDASS